MNALRKWGKWGHSAFPAAQKKQSVPVQSGFTLIEVLLVIVIILMLAGAIVAFLLPQQEGAEKNTTRLLLTQVASALDTYRLNMGHYPTEEEGGLNALAKKPTFENERMADKWQGPYLKPGTVLEDPWGNTIRYEPVDTSLDEFLANRLGPLEGQLLVDLPRSEVVGVTDDGDPPYRLSARR